MVPAWLSANIRGSMHSPHSTPVPSGRDFLPPMRFLRDQILAQLDTGARWRNGRRRQCCRCALLGQRTLHLTIYRNGKRVRATSNVGSDVVQFSASSREMGFVSPFVPCPVIGPPFLRQVLYLIMRTSSMYYTACLIAIM
jgi:hypothetical protein